MEKKIKVEIWSDILCPFCYIGKRKFEAALFNFAHKDLVQVTWHSYVLNPNMPYFPNKDIYTHIAEIKGQTREWSINAHQSLVQTAKNVGLDYNFDNVKVSGSLDAHRIIQFAKKHGPTDQIEERFFRAYFTEGALISDHETLINLATEVGLDKNEVANALLTNQFVEEVRIDSELGKQLGVKGIPYFIINNTCSISGAQEPNTFFNALENAYNDLK